MKRILTMLFLLLLFSKISEGQATLPTGKMVVMPSPNIATLQRFGDYPVSYSTGLAQVGISLYDIKSKDFSFPVSIDCHASGIMAGYNFSSLGMGWALTATGFISREIRGRPDEGSYNDLQITKHDLDSITSTSMHGSYDMLVGADMDITNGDAAAYSYGKYDPERDIFTFSINGLSGKFIMSNNGTIVQLASHKDGLDIQGTVNGFTITDGKGVTYEFGHVYEGVVEYGALETVIINELSGPGGSVSPRTVNSSWFLAKVTAPGGQVIKLKYGSIATAASIMDNISGTSMYQGIATVGYGEYDYGGIGSGGSPAYGEMYDYFNGYNLGSRGFKQSTVYSGNDYTMHYVTNITFATGSIDFTYDSTYFLLTDFFVKDKAGQQVKKATFNYGYGDPVLGYGLNNSNTTLTTLKMYGAPNSKAEIYTFTYFPGGGSAWGKDWWGYAKGTTALPPKDPSDADFTGSYADMNAGASSRGMLKRINYPTGGYREFEYEANLYPGPGGAHLSGPGIRIKSIVSDDGTGTNKITKLYKYGSGESGLGYLMYPPSPSDFITDQMHMVVQTGLLSQPLYMGYFRVRTYSSDPIPGMVDAYRQPMFYDYVTEYTKADDASLNGKIIYTYSQPQYEVLGYGNLKTFKLKPWLGNKLEAKDVFKYKGGGYVPLESNTTGYHEFHYSKIPQIKLKRITLFDYADRQYNREIETEMLENYIFSGVLGNPYEYMDNPFESGVELPFVESHTTYDSQGGKYLQTITNYYYDSQNHLQPTRIVSKTSRGDTLMSENRYLGDLNGNQYTDVAESRTYRIKGGSKRLLTSTNTTWNAPGYPDEVYAIETATPLVSFDTLYKSPISGVITKDSRYVSKQKFNYYGTKVKEQYATGDAHTSYLWSYNGEYPIAEIKNANYSTVDSILTSAAIAAMYNQSNPSLVDLNAFLAPLRTDSRLSNAQITTYSYKPLIGMSSMTDPKGMTTYYQYDGSNRLSLVLDQNTNIVKAYCYNYKNQGGGCPINQVVYARVEMGNGHTYDYPAEETEYYYHKQYSVTADARIGFYIDSACTIPKIMPAGLVVTVTRTHTTDNDTGHHVATDNWNYTLSSAASTLPVAGTGTLSGQWVTYVYDEYHDYVTGASSISYDNYSYDTATHSGSNYTPWVGINY